MPDQKQECCPKFNYTLWDNKIFEWNNKTFIQDKVFTLFYIPINFGSVIRKMIKKIEKAEDKISEWMCLSDHTSKWNMDLYLPTSKEIPNAKNVVLNGKFFSKVYEGNFKEMGKWTQNFEGYVKHLGLEVKKLYIWYTTCPKCAKKYGKNYVVLIAKIK
jgi:hypothetical protein